MLQAVRQGRRAVGVLQVRNLKKGDGSMCDGCSGSGACDVCDGYGDLTDGGAECPACDGTGVCPACYGMEKTG